jgi:hypothetical protein
MPPSPRNASVPVVLPGRFTSLLPSGGGMLDRPRRVIAPGGGGGGGRKVLFRFELLTVEVRGKPNPASRRKENGKGLGATWCYVKTRQT